MPKATLRRLLTAIFDRALLRMQRIVGPAVVLRRGTGKSR